MEGILIDYAATSSSCSSVRSTITPFSNLTPARTPFLTAEDLTVFKMSFGRTRDWADIEAMIVAGTPIDADYVEHQLVQFKGPAAYPSAARLRAMLRGQPE